MNQSYTRQGQRPAHASVLLLSVIRRTVLSPGFVRVTLGGADVARFEPMGFDQWARLFIGASSRGAVPHPLTPRAYVRHVLARDERPLMRSFTIAGARSDELDIDVAVHAAATPWGHVGQPVALLDQGTGFVAPPGAPVCLVGDASALPAIAGILRSLPADAVGRVVVQLPAEDRRDLPRPAGVTVSYGGPDELEALDVVTDPAMYGWVAGEASMVARVRRTWVTEGVPKDRIAFCGYWRR